MLNKGRSGATGPRSAEGKRKSAANARRYPFTAHHETNDAAAARIAAIAEALLGGTPCSGPVKERATEAARSHFTCEMIRSYRADLLRRLEWQPWIYRGPYYASDNRLIMTALKHEWQGKTYSSLAVQDMLHRFSKEPPRETTARHAALLAAQCETLERLDRYEARELARRRRLFRALDLAIVS